VERVITFFKGNGGGEFCVLVYRDETVVEIEGGVRFGFTLDGDSFFLRSEKVSVWFRRADG